MRLLYAVGYVVWLFGQVLLGSLEVAREAVSPRSRIAPVILRLPLRLETDTEIATFASSITITPGTLTIGIEEAGDDRPATLHVHATFADDTVGVVEGLREMESRLLLMFRGRDGRARALERPVPPVPGVEEVAGGGAGRSDAGGDGVEEER